MSRMLRLALLLVTIGAVCALAFGTFVKHEIHRAMHTPVALTRPMLLRVVPGSGVGDIARQLEAEGMLADYRLFALRARLDGVAEHIQAGTYEIAPGDTLARVLERLVAGRVKIFDVTFIEGCLFADMRRVLRSQDHLEHDLPGLSDAQVLRRLDLDADSPEGLFFPSTYHFEDGARDTTILARSAARMKEVLTRAWDARAAGLPYTEPYDALIMASIVEKETARADERARIAGVFVRRLSRGMKLQTDPTVIYGLGARFDGDLRRADLLRDTPYNTYVHAGLPPTPIAMPGQGSIEAALNPAPGKALYFVATGEGGHHFSESLSEHNKAVRRYQLKR